MTSDEHPQDADRSIPAAVPEFNEYFANIDGAGDEQKSYYEWFLTEIEAGRTPDVEGNLSYVFAYMYPVIREFAETSEYDVLARRFQLLRDGYADTKIPSYLNQWQSDAAMHASRWDEAWRYRTRVEPNFIRTTAAKLGSQRLNPLDVRTVAKNTGVTDWGRRRKAQVDEALQTLLDRIHDELGLNFIDWFCDEFERLEASGQDSWLEALIEDLDFNADYDYIKGAATAHEPSRQVSNGKKRRSLFMGVQLGSKVAVEQHVVFSMTNTMPVRLEVEMVGVSYLATLIVEARAKMLLRDAENIVREQAGLPRVGDGWISETELFHLVRDAFPQERVAQHARPGWLVPQHLDVFLPDANIAIEFQGEQHYRPVSIFGGEEGFVRQVERDKRKKAACAKNDCLLIEVASGFDRNALLETIRNEIVFRAGITD